MNPRVVLLVAMAVVLNACASSGGYQPIIDTDGVDMVEYEYDLARCQAHARRISPGDSIAGGAVAGAVLGAALGLAAGDSRWFAQRGAAVGAVSGAVGSGGEAMHAQAQIVRNCMAARGYYVLY